MKTTADSIKRELKNQYECACNRYVAELLRIWELDSFYGYWIGDDVGGIYEYESGFNISMENIIYCVDNDVTEEQYMEWTDYICDASEFNMDTPSLRSWMKGCPRTPQETFERLRGLKENLRMAVEEETERVARETAEQNDL